MNSFCTLKVDRQLYSMILILHQTLQREKRVRKKRRCHISTYN